MSRRVPLNRLSHIFKQPSIGRPIMVPLPIDELEDSPDTPKTKVKWPVPD